MKRGLTMALALVPAMAVTLGGCTVVPRDVAGGTGERQMTVYFSRARSFYPHSRVKVMGADVGRVDRVQNVGNRIKVDFHIRDDVPLPRGVKASIVPFNLIGERNLVLHPVWQPGQPKETSNVIDDPARTHVPVEVDDALKSITNIANALDPYKVRTTMGKAADAVNGNGREFNAALEQGARLADNIAAQDKDLMRVAKNLDRVAGVVRGREQVLGQLIRDFGQASQIMAGERQQLQELVRGLLDLTKSGNSLLAKYEDQLPYDMAVITRTSLMLRGNSESLTQLLKALPGLGGGVINAYNKEHKVLNLRFAVDAYLRMWLTALMDKDGQPCPLPPPNSNCPWMNKGGRS